MTTLVKKYTFSKTKSFVRKYLPKAITNNISYDEEILYQTIKDYIEEYIYENIALPDDLIKIIISYTNSFIDTIVNIKEKFDFHLPEPKRYRDLSIYLTNILVKYYRDLVLPPNTKVFFICDGGIWFWI